MMKNKENIKKSFKLTTSAFTLIELLIIIGVLSFVLVISVPKLVVTMNKSKNKALETTVRLIVSSAESKYMEYQTMGIKDEIKCSDVAEISDKDYKYCGISFDKDGKAKVTIVGTGKYDGKYVCEGTKKEVVTHDSICDGPIPTNILQELFEFEYYSSLVNAVEDVNNNEIGVNADATKENAVAGIYTDDDKEYVVLLKDTTETTKIAPLKDLTINLGGNVLTSNSTVAIDGAASHTDTITIDGRLNGSTIICNGSQDGTVMAQTRKNKFIFNGGTYIVYESEASTDRKVRIFSINGGGNIELNDGVARGYSSNNLVGGYVIGSVVSSGGSMTITNSNIDVYSNAGFKENIPVSAYAVGVENYGILTINNSSIKSYSNYNSDQYAYGIRNNESGTLTVYNSYAMASTCALGSFGDLFVDGGTYESFGTGALYLSGADTVKYIRNVVLRNIDMPNGYLSNYKVNGSGIIIGGKSNANNNSIYMDNCDIYGKTKPILLRGVAGEVNNTLYISNSRIHGSGVIDIANDTHKLYIGRGNNFTAANTNRESSVVTTDEVYIKSE